jgi:hypothetical protein
MADTKIEDFAPGKGEEISKVENLDQTGAMMGECPKIGPTDGVIPVQAKIAACRNEWRKLPRNRRRSPSVFYRVTASLKTSLLKSSPEQLPIRSLPWPVCCWKNQGVMKFV